MELTNNFTLDEFLSERDSVEPSEEVIANLQLLANKLQTLRDTLDAPIFINSGYRSKEYNEIVQLEANPNYKPGTSRSMHIKGMAADIRVKGYTPKEVQEALKEWGGGMGSYDTFTHIDIRNWVARW